MSERPNATLLLNHFRGCSGCWPLLCMISVGDNEVRWRDFEQPHRGVSSGAWWWDYSGFPGFTFEKAQYLDALSVLKTPLCVASGIIRANKMVLITEGPNP